MSDKPVPTPEHSCDCEKCGASCECANCQCADCTCRSCSH